MAPARRHIGASRRKRREDEGEDEGSQVGELDDDSLSEGSVGSHQEDEDADGEVSESDGEASTSLDTDKLNGRKTNGRNPNQPEQRSSTTPRKPGLKMTVSDTEAMLNGLKLSDDGDEISFDQMEEQRDLQTGRTPSAPPTEPKRETLASRKRREHEKYVKERDQNPAFVPTRGSFFLHDKRTSEAGSNSHRPFNKGKSRPVGLIVDGNSRKNSTSKPDASEGQWTHDLHETVAGENPAPKQVSTTAGSYPSIQNVPTAPRSDPPNRSFSSTTLIGNVPVVVFLPGMTQPKSFPAVPKKQHTRLPQHRPPLRRDKPVRISLPGQPPRYIFPSIERSFIFIPRALRPNQQGYRGRGRGGGFYPGRRPSYYNTYTPSVLSVSRRSSLGMSVSQDGYPSPAGSVYSRPAMVVPDVSKHVLWTPVIGLISLIWTGFSLLMDDTSFRFLSKSFFFFFSCALFLLVSPFLFFIFLVPPPSSVPLNLFFFPFSFFIFWFLLSDIFLFSLPVLLDLDYSDAFERSSPSLIFHVPPQNPPSSSFPSLISL
ncbi:hypothetical protein PMG11_05567 [Penicillium brasilianum]|uniref:Btz domain-containing protein n=1 Tax=Penicillium brasilianum TaxID=104259 RepID=A0A0F7TN49_PENBI|nr:hypothetical protein PMG11_05567 [Penicillium brasilianum]